MIGFRERERTRSERRVFGPRAAIFFLWVILVFALISLFLSIHLESRSRSSHAVSFRRSLFHAPLSRTRTGQARFVGKNGDDDAETTLYGDGKRVIHTGPNPLHN